MDAVAARDLFDSNARTYDRVNSFISLGLDARWYEWAASRAVTEPGTRVLDAFAGTGAVGLRAAARHGLVTLADASPAMLELASDRARQRGLSVRTDVTDLSAEPLDVEGAPFDAITIMWGLRYVDEPVRVIRNLARLLVDGGRLVIVEFVDPPTWSPARFYFFHVLPWVAGLLAGRRRLYRELIASTHRMGPPQRLAEMVEAAGMTIVERKSMGFGLVLGIVATLTAPRPFV